MSDREVRLDGIQWTGVNMGRSTCNDYKHMVSIDADVTGLSVHSTTQDSVRRHDVSITRDGVQHVNDILSEHLQRNTCRSDDTSDGVNRVAARIQLCTFTYNYTFIYLYVYQCCY